MGAAMSEPKPFASLGPMLLARKGTAKPAMRAMLGQDARMAELSDELDALADSQDALGWNDMGECGDRVVALPVANDRNGKAVKRDRKAAGLTRKAFTLRLEAERHLRLRLASTLRDCSAQVLVTEALDRFLDNIPELDAIAAEMQRKDKKA